MDHKILNKVRRSTRLMVRKFGFMNRTLAGTEYSPSAVHALLEIDELGQCTAKRLSERLYLEKSSISRMISSLIRKGEIQDYRSENDGREKLLILSRQGIDTVSKIHAFGNTQAAKALEKMDDESLKVAIQGLDLYASSLLPDREISISNEITIHEGYENKLIGTITSLHSEIYSEIAGFGAYFEALVGRNFSEFIMNIDNINNQTWYAKQNEKIVGGISIDGNDLEEGQAHLRWFVVDPTIQSKGIGKLLMLKAMQYCEERDFKEVHLWTIKGLEATRKLYERNKFELVHEEWGTRYGAKVLERKYVRVLS